MTPTLIRPQDFPEAKWLELETYLADHWRRALDGRVKQVDSDFHKWEKNYRAQPREKVRSVPWVGASNFVVPLIRMFLDTFVARSLGIIFATRPLYTVKGYPREVKESLEAYLEFKALQDWNHWSLVRDMVFRGNKNGTCVVKVPWEETIVYEMKEQGAEYVDTPLVEYAGPRASVIPFEDFYCYPITANYMRELLIKFHRVRLVEEEARLKLSATKWKRVTPQDLEGYLEYPADVKRTEDQAQAGVHDSHLRVCHTLECYLKWPMSSDPSRLYNIVATLLPGPGNASPKLVDIYFNPYEELFFDYRPFPREDLFYGESMCEILEQSQEETSTIHNDRRNNSYLSNAPVFKRKSGSMLPNPSSNWYPGKCWDVDSMDDFEVVAIGRNYDSMLDQEEFDLQLAERLIGFGAIAQGFASGVMGRRGVYNSQGTMAILSESNQRQDINIRDIREVLGAIGKASFTLQRLYGHEDPALALFSEKQQSEIKQALAYGDREFLRRVRFTVETSSAAKNSETERAALMNMMQVLGNYGATVQQMSMMLADPKLNPSLRLIMNDIIHMHKWMAARVLRAFREEDIEEVLPDVAGAIEATVPGGGRGTRGSAPTGLPAGEAGMDLGGLSEPGALPNRGQLEAVLALPGGNGANPRGANLLGSDLGSLPFPPGAE